jgi:hypothetical protein
MTTEEKPIEYEQVTIKVPKPIMAFLRIQVERQDQFGFEDFASVEELIEYDLLDGVRAEMEGFSGEELIATLDLGPIFYKILDDERYKPKEKTN